MSCQTHCYWRRCGELWNVEKWVNIRVDCEGLTSANADVNVHSVDDVNCTRDMCCWLSAALGRTVGKSTSGPTIDRLGPNPTQTRTSLAVNWHCILNCCVDCCGRRWMNGRLSDCPLINWLLWTANLELLWKCVRRLQKRNTDTIG